MAYYGNARQGGVNGHYYHVFGTVRRVAFLCFTPFLTSALADPPCVAIVLPYPCGPSRGRQHDWERRCRRCKRMSMIIIIGRARRAAGAVKWVYLFSVQKRVPCIALRVVIVDLFLLFFAVSGLDYQCGERGASLNRMQPLNVASEDAERKVVWARTRNELT